MEKNETVLVIKSYRSDKVEAGKIKAKEGSYGLCGSLWGEGVMAPPTLAEDVFVLEVERDAIVQISPDGEVVFLEGGVVFCGDKETAAQYVKDRAPERAVNFCTMKVGDKSVAVVGTRGTAIAGRHGKAIARYKGTATAGDYGTAIAGDKGTAMVGEGGVAIVGDEGTAKAGENGILLISYWDYEERREQTAIGCVGKNGLMPDTPYRLNENNEFVEVVQADD